MLSVNATALVPVGINCSGVTFPNALVGPHSNQAVVAALFEFTLPTSVAPSPARFVAGCVDTVGFEAVAAGKLT